MFFPLLTYFAPFLPFALWAASKKTVKTQVTPETAQKIEQAEQSGLLYVGLFIAGIFLVTYFTKRK